MAGSEAEERIRAKLVAYMRDRWPTGRIVHELVLEQMGIRLDVASVTEACLIIAEVKSEKDTLKRLVAQLTKAREVGCHVILAVAAKHGPAVEAMRMGRTVAGETEAQREARYAASRSLHRVEVLVEQGPLGALVPDGWGKSRSSDTPPRDPRQVFDLMWADEMHVAMRRHWGVPTMKEMTRARMTAEAVEHMSGRDIRLAVCAALRNRRFARADAPVSETQT